MFFQLQKYTKVIASILIMTSYDIFLVDIYVVIE